MQLISAPTNLGLREGDEHAEELRALLPHVVSGRAVLAAGGGRHRRRRVVGPRIGVHTDPTR